MQRYWDGAAWTQHVAGTAGGAPTADPLPIDPAWPLPGQTPPAAVPDPPSPPPEAPPGPPPSDPTPLAPVPAPSTPRTLSPPPPDAADTVAAELPAGVVYARPWLRLASYWLQGFLFVVTLGIGWLVWAAVIAREGQTPAKRLLNLRVLRVGTLQPVGFARMFWLRGLVAGLVCAIVLPLSLFILALLPFWNPRHQNLWDKLSGTYVVNDLFGAFDAIDTGDAASDLAGPG